ncbi:Bifunctional protein PutA [Posidoniimonas corsicana]|uniref:L-glutamate gamma-semialdehyde dehydrogenase n=1 Tax=Posidoniimonas corsicana TaxID=1938618 RepID=A0A5C5VE57_9BACT|nr:bifunctional proline dehydrogenase/L-glutamate gamma-semialdehyde dehydrogenase [Posidoniimonas corsicana]TWT36906.1 Bifunctional protein PutA [Posidoniimonas corsicana]
MPPILPAPTVAQVEEELAKLLTGFEADSESPVPLPVQETLWVARRLQQRATELQTPPERRQQAELNRMMQNPGDKATMVQLTDQAFRSGVWGRAADQFIHVLDAQGIPRFFSPIERTMLRGFQSFGAYLPGVAMPMVKDKMQHETANVVLPAEAELLTKHLTRRREEGVRMNVNQLGEALLGEREAQHRLDGYLASLQKPEVEVISVKISTIYSQISPLARRHTTDVLADRLELLFRAASRGKFTRADGQVVPKFVYLDMEEYRDLHLTAEAFMQTLDRPGLEGVHAGIVLQAYIPDSYGVQQRINAWARERVAAGGAPITMRIVKGANMEMERVEASIRGWPQAPYKTKLETDANYKRMLHEGLSDENRAAVRLGIASHNLFTLAYGLVASAHAGALADVQFEMLEGMASHQRRALFELSQNVLLYAPTCYQRDFIHAIGYLIRRLDENTGPDNFLRHAFNISVGNEAWQELESQFVKSFEAIDDVRSEPRRTQDRRCEKGMTKGERGSEQASPDLRFPDFSNEPDTDWALPHHSEWADSIIKEWAAKRDDQAAEVPLVIAGEQLAPDAAISESTDPSRPGAVVARFRQASLEEADRALRCAVEDPSDWSRRSPDERREALHRVAEEIAADRGDLLGVMLAEGGKLLTESDPEVSEAIDFCRFYADSASAFHALPGVAAREKGVVVVVSPWNFPLAIPCGGIAAALAAGNRVILKPASDTVLIAYRLCECFWQAGVPREALQFMPCPGASVGQHLAAHPSVDAVILTGGTETAQRMLAAKPSMNLYAETGGKNATIVTALADRDLAIKNVLHSAFGHSGQKCSATSLLILEDEVYHDAGFRDALVDAVTSLRVGSAWELPTKMGPLIRPPSGELERGLKELEEGESWCVMPKLRVGDNPSLVSPGVKWGVPAGGFTHNTEFFGPLLGVMHAKNLRHAIELVNATGFGLTSGIESLDDREQELWRHTIRAGNLYLNRSTTGAIVLRQPFGGMGKSNVGPGMKAGGPNYVAQFMHLERSGPPASTATSADPDLASELSTFVGEVAAAIGLQSDETAAIQGTVADYAAAAESEFLRSHDHFRLVGEDNFRRYLPMEVLRARVHGDDSVHDVLAMIAAGRAVGCRVIVSASPAVADKRRELFDAIDAATELWAGGLEMLEESVEQLAETVAAGRSGRVRFTSPDRVHEAVREAKAAAMLYLADEPITRRGRVDLLWCLHEQSVCNMYHRYGNLGDRADEQRAEPL